MNASAHSPESYLSNRTIADLVQLRRNYKTLRHWIAGETVSLELVSRRGSFGDRCWLAWFQFQSCKYTLALNSIESALQLQPSDVQALKFRTQVMQARAEIDLKEEARRRIEVQRREAERTRQIESEVKARQETERKKQELERWQQSLVLAVSELEQEKNTSYTESELFNLLNNSSATILHNRNTNLLVETIRQRYHTYTARSQSVGSDIEGNIAFFERCVLEDKIEGGSIVFDDNEHANRFLSARLTKLLRNLRGVSQELITPKPKYG